MSDTRYTKVAITLHWVIALAILIQLGTGIIMGFDLMAKPVLFHMFQFHKSMGLTVLVLSLFRLFWRLTHKAPSLPSHMPAWEKFAAKASHYLFYVFMIGVPLTGWLIVSSSSFGLPTMWFNLFEWPHIPGIEHLADATKDQVHEVAEESHSVMAYATLALLGLHIAAALKHHFIDHDEVLHHMIPCIKQRLPKAPLSLIAALCLISFPVNAATWLTGPDKGTIGFAGENSGEKFSGKFENWSADIDFDPVNPANAKVKVTIKTGSAKTGTTMFDETLPKKEWFDAETLPDAIFETKSIKSHGDGTYEAIGTLTIKGHAHEVTMPFTLAVKDKTATMTSELKLNRLDFEIGTKPDPKAEWVSKDIDISIKLDAVQK